MKKIMILGVFLATIGPVGCGTNGNEARVEGEVIKISGTLPALFQSAGALFGNESVRISDATLVYMIRNTKGEVTTLNIREHTQVPRATLIARICLGTKISYIVKIVEAKADGSEKNDPNWHVGSSYSNDILVPTPCTE